MASFVPQWSFLVPFAEVTRQDREGSRDRRGSIILPRSYIVTAAIWVLIASIFLLDLLTPADDVAVCFAYLIPIFLSLLEAAPKPLRYASVASALSLVGLRVQPPHLMTTVMMVLIATVTQWVVAILVRLQQHRLVEAQERAESQRRFVDILSHEVGTALTTVNGQAYRLAKLSEQVSPDDLRMRAEKIRKAAERIQVIVSRIQFASSLGDGSIPTGEESINLHAMIRQLTEQMKEEQQGRRFELSLCPDPKLVAGDEMLLRQAFENVIANSIKYSASDSPIDVSVADHGSTVRVTVTDRGSGIAEDDIPRVRTAYYRGPNSKGTRGAGLGLYVVEKLIEAHRGRLAIESEVGSGTRVIIDLPQITQAASA